MCQSAHSTASTRLVTSKHNYLNHPRNDGQKVVAALQENKIKLLIEQKNRLGIIITKK